MATIPVPLELVISGRELSEPRLSPDGASVAFVHRWRGTSAVSVVHLDDASSVERLVTTRPDPSAGRGLGGGCLTWTADGRGLLYAAVDGELWRVAGASVEQLTELGRVVRSPASAANGSVVFAVDEAEVWVVDPASAAGRRGGVRRLDDGRHAFCLDPSVSPDGRVVSWLGWNPPDMPWDGAERVDLEVSTGLIRVTAIAGGAVQQPRFAPDGTPTCVQDGSGWLNVTIGDEAIEDAHEHAGPTWGPGQRSYDVAADGTVVFTRNEAGFGALYRGDVRTGERTALARGVHGQLHVVGTRLVALRQEARTPPHVVVHELSRSGAPRRVVAHSVPAGWDHVVLPEPESVQVPHEGVTLHARRFVAGQGRLLCWVHGGPTDQWQVDFRPRIAYWWSRGWDVLVVDPRGSTGHGRAYQRALNGAWGRLDVDDTAALLRHAHAAGWATPSTTAVIGGSSGGLTVLGVLADHHRLVAGGVTSYPVSDLHALAAVTHRFEAHYTDTLVGPDATTERYAELSPLHRADRIAGPLLVFHGTDDLVVPIEQTRALVEAVRAGGGDVSLIVYEGEGHGFRDPEHVRDEYERTGRFLDGVVRSREARV